MNTQFKTLIIAFIAIFVTSCSDDDDASGPIGEDLTTLQIIQNSPNHTILEQLLDDAGLSQTLNDGVYTIFAPTDDAFGNINTSSLSADQARNLLLNHVLVGAAMSSNLITSYQTTLATEQISGNENPLSLYVNVGSEITLNGISTVTGPDNLATNGVVHIVDEVITIPNVTTFATADSTFEVLVQALTREDQPDFVGTLSSFEAPAPFTVFAPTNEAFAALLDELGIGSLADVPAATLEATLNSHVIAGANVTSGMLSSGTVTTLGGDISIDAENATITDSNGRIIEIILTDVQAGNGVIHAIDRVILPDSAIETTFEIISESPDHTVLEQALIDANLVDALNSGEYTVFAPTDAAFGLIDISGLSAAQVSNVLLNHVVDGTFLSTDLSTTYVNTLAVETNTGNDNNLSLYINTDSGVSLNGISSVTTADLEADNGVVHVVDEVITIPDVTTFATADPNFSTLVAALTREPGFTYVSTLQSTDSPAPFTVFAPTNAAFVDLLDELNVNSLADIPTATLEATLDTHVIPGTNVTSSTLASGTVSTLGDDIIIDAQNTTITDLNGRISNIIAVDVQAGNGVIHAIDKVLLPNQQ
ncbi:fasciclin domain-containing protein [Psychroflexus sediminis]|uniref:Uncaracterized surface protein containing fasciclin (FAS1) repeats n=1 Tax=Psychroflexus sediminis TaxID=470826 RepID=A0A1G7WBZ6_9FLAO|nr:fasciclin domain-containing protein [Psychroflexus sediminis]SDG69414.1 Uncaracterized surface protein containing fasciclin (FAS1) repeats [Psychroflexus sediminis]